MSTRKAPPGAPFKQQRYASSSEYESGLLGNLVAKRCERLESAEDRELIWMLQYLSNCEGGLKKVAADLREKFTDRIGTRQMREAGVKPGGRYNAEQVRKIRESMLPGEFDEFLLEGEEPDFEPVDEQTAWGNEGVAKARAEAARLPTSYPVADFLKVCVRAASNLESDLKEICLNPGRDLEPWYFHELRDCLRDYQSNLRPGGFAPTSLAQSIWSEIDDACEMGGAVLLHNSAGNGKSFAAEAYCRANPGRARYALTPSSNDEVGFLREIAKPLGVASGLSFKAVQIRERIIQALLPGDLVLVIDSAQNLFPVTDYRYALPNRLNWVLELAERGVPIVLIADSRMFETLGFVEARTGWNRSKFVNQLSRVVELPGVLEKEDVQAVAATLLPDGDRAAHKKLADYMIVAPGYLHSGKTAAKRARQIAAANHRDRVTLDDMNEALETSMKPAFNALASGLKRADAAAAKCKSKVRNWRPETPAQIAAKSGRRRNQIVTSSDLKRPADSRAEEPDFRPSGTNRIGNPDAVPGRQQIDPDLVNA